MYYKDGIIASYMGLQFGVTYRLTEEITDKTIIFENKVNNINDVMSLLNVDSYSTLGGDSYYNIILPDKFVIHPSSWHIFQPQVGDMVTKINRHGWIIDKITEDCYISVFQGTEYIIKKEEAVIIQRNGKAFIMPERGE